MVARLARPVRSVRLPGCKSLTARALVLAACARGESRLVGASDSDDSRSLRESLAGLGAGIGPLPDGRGWSVRGWDGPPVARGVQVDVGAAGASFRFLLPLLAAGDTDVVVRGTRRLFERPQEPLYEFLRARGTLIERFSDAQGEAVRVQGRGLPGGEWEAPLAGTSQFLSGLLLASQWSGDLLIRLSGPVPSAGYLDLTFEALRAFRGPATAIAVSGGIRVRPGAPVACEYQVPGDPSAATFFLVALVLCGGRALLSEPWSMVHPEARLLRRLFDSDLLRADQAGFEATGRVPDGPLVFDIDGAPDAGPALAVLGAFLPQGVVLENVDRLRLKESDRVAGIERLLAALGRASRLAGGDLVVPPGAA
ncbi:MAG TPA: hypothetical protein VGC54_03410, partial [Planctomycetota bacterium]